MSEQYGNAPPLVHLENESDRVLIVSLRKAVAPILANNILPYFTDHSVAHSDNVTLLVDKLIEPLQSTQNKLNSKELIILYSACYLHDIGLQYENAGESQVVKGLNLEQRWEELNESTRRDLLRKYHHLISAEMVNSSVVSAKPIIGINLTSEYEPGRIACLCEAHNLYHENEKDYERYLLLTQKGPQIRMELLSGLLRVADILEESRRRAPIEKARTLQLPIESQAHWWRHYYTEHVEVDKVERTIEIWFDFPKEQFSEYSRVIPKLQIPWIEAELERHKMVFNKYSSNWYLKPRYSQKEYSDTQAMPDEVMSFMLQEIHSQKLYEDIAIRESKINHFVEARPYINRRLDELNLNKESKLPDEVLEERFKISNEMWSIGSKRSAIMSLVYEYQRDAKHLNEDNRIKIGTRLLEMILQEGVLSLANNWILDLQQLCQQDSEKTKEKTRCLLLISDWFERRGAYEQALQSINSTIERMDDETSKKKLHAKISELHFLQGQLHKVDCQDTPKEN